MTARVINDPSSLGWEYDPDTGRWSWGGGSSSGGGGGTFPEAPVDGEQYARQNASWSVIEYPEGDGGGNYVPYTEPFSNELMALRLTDLGAEASLRENGGAPQGWSEIEVTSGVDGGSIGLSSMQGKNGESVTLTLSNNWSENVPLEAKVSDGVSNATQLVQYADKLLLTGGPIQAPDFLDADGNSIIGGGGGGIPDAPADSAIYGRKNNDWVVVPTSGGGDGPDMGLYYTASQCDTKFQPKGSYAAANHSHSNYAAKSHTHSSTSQRVTT